MHRNDNTRYVATTIGYRRERFAQVAWQSLTADQTLTVSFALNTFPLL